MAGRDLVRSGLVAAGLQHAGVAELARGRLAVERGLQVRRRSGQEHVCLLRSVGYGDLRSDSGDSVVERHEGHDGLEVPVCVQPAELVQPVQEGGEPAAGTEVRRGRGHHDPHRLELGQLRVRVSDQQHEAEQHRLQCIPDPPWSSVLGDDQRPQARIDRKVTGWVSVVGARRRPDQQAGGDDLDHRVRGELVDAGAELGQLRERRDRHRQQADRASSRLAGADGQLRRVRLPARVRIDVAQGDRDAVPLYEVPHPAWRPVW